MTRPRRLYQEGGNYYYLIGGAKKKIKVPEGISQRQLQKINIKNIINLAERRRVKRRKKPVKVRYGKKIVSQMEKEPQPEQVQPALSTYLFKPKLAVKTLDELAQADVDSNVDKLANKLLTRLQPVVTPPTIPEPATIANLPPALPGVSTSVPTEGETPPTTEQSPTITEGETPPTTEVQPPAPKGVMQRVAESIGLRRPEPATPPPSETSQTKFAFTNKYEQNYIYDVLKELKSEDASFDITSSTDYKINQQKVIERISKKRNIPISNFVKPTQKTLVGIFEGTRIGRGDGEDDGLYNDEIEEIARKSIKNYVPVIASDEINTLSKHVKNGDKRFAFIINTNPSTSDGSGEDGHRPGHWRAVYINNDDDFPSVEYFDPLCEGRIPNDLLKVCMKIARKMNPEMMFKYKQNMLRRQSKLSSNCGYHSLAFIEDRYNGVPWSEATGYDDYMEKLNEVKDDSRDGEKDVMKYIKKYESYI